MIGGTMNQLDGIVSDHAAKSGWDVWGNKLTA